jgi:hypothetical protein
MPGHYGKSAAKKKSPAMKKPARNPKDRPGYKAPAKKGKK